MGDKKKKVIPNADDQVAAAADADAENIYEEIIEVKKADDNAETGNRKPLPMFQHVSIIGDPEVLDQNQQATSEAELTRPAELPKPNSKPKKSKTKKTSTNELSLAAAEEQV